MCLVGAGRVAKVHANSLVNHVPNSKLVALVDTNLEVLSGVANQFDLVTPIHRRWPERFTWGYIREKEHFIEPIQKGVSPKVTGEDGCWAVAGVFAGTKSFLENRPVYLSEVLVGERRG